MSGFSQSDASLDQNTAGVMPGMVMQPNMAPGQVYRQHSMPMTYYAPMPMGQGMVPPQGYVQPQQMYPAPAYPQDMMANNMSPQPYQQHQPQMMPANMMPTNGQPMYQVYYPQQNTGVPPGQYNGPY
jgi:hypothetical protein